MTTTFQPEATAEERRDALAAYFKQQRESKAERAKAATLAIAAMTRLTTVMRQKTDQSATLRTLLYSMWNNNPCANLCDIVLLDWSIRKDLGEVLLGFGFESPDVSFFYDAMKQIITRVGSSAPSV